MKTLLALAFGFISSWIYAQVSIHVAFNISNCRAYSKELAYLEVVDSQIKKHILLNAQDRNVLSEIVESFGLGNLQNVTYDFLPISELRRHFTDNGIPMVYIIEKEDTTSSFPLYELPNRVELLNNYNSPSLQIDTIWLKETLSVGSDITIAANQSKVWVLDRFLQKMYTIHVSSDSISSTPLDSTLAILNHILDSVHLGRLLGNSVIEYKGFAFADPSTDEVVLDVLHYNLTESERNGRLLVHLSKGTISNVITAQDMSTDGVMPLLLTSGYWPVGDYILTQVFTTNAREKLPLFGLFKPQSHSLSLTQVVDYDYPKEWSNFGPYQMINGIFCEEWFVFSVAPIFVNTSNWKDYDLSMQLDLSIDSCMQMIPGYYFGIDTYYENQELTLLSLYKGSYRISVINTKAEPAVIFDQRFNRADISKMVVIGPGQFIGLSNDRRYLIKGTIRNSH